MPFPSGVLPTNRNMPWNSSWKIHLIPARLFFRPPRILSHQYESELERVFPFFIRYYERRQPDGSLPSLLNGVCLSFLFLHLSLSAPSPSFFCYCSGCNLWNRPWKCAVLGVTHLQMKWLCYTGGRPAVSRESDQPVNWYTVHDFIGHWRIFHTLSNTALIYIYSMPIR